jgi:hypothetical protein
MTGASSKENPDNLSNERCRMNVFTQEVTEATYALVKEHQETTGKGLPAPELSKKLLGNSKYREVIGLIVDLGLEGRVEATQGPGGGYVLVGVKRQKGRFTREMLTPELKQDVVDIINTQLKFLPPNKGTDAKSVFLGLVQSNKNYTLQLVTAAIELLLEEGKYIRLPAIGIQHLKE